jgi:hypothetical protein
MAFLRTAPAARSPRVGRGGRLRTLPAGDVGGCLFTDLDAALRTG